MRKELSVFIKTNSIDEDDELMISTTTKNDIVVITLPAGAKVGVNVEYLLNALYEVKTFKTLNPNVETGDKKEGFINNLHVAYE